MKEQGRMNAENWWPEKPRKMGCNKKVVLLNCEHCELSYTHQKNL